MRIANPEIDEILARRYWSIDNIPYNKPGDASHRRYTAEIDEIEDELTALVGDEELMIELCEDYEADDGEETHIYVKWVAEQVSPNHEDGDETRIFLKWANEKDPDDDDRLTFYRCIQDIWQRPEYAENFVVKLAKRRMDDYEREEARKAKLAALCPQCGLNYGAGRPYCQYCGFRRAGSAA